MPRRANLQIQWSPWFTRRDGASSPFWIPGAGSSGSRSSAQNRAALVPVDVDEVFEARVFNRKAELRWLNDPTGKHRTVVVAETPVSWLKADPSPTPCVGTINHWYVIREASRARTGRPPG